MSDTDVPTQEIQVLMPPEMIEWLDRLSGNDYDRRSEIVRTAVAVHVATTTIIERLGGLTETELGAVATFIDTLPRSGHTCPCAGRDTPHRPGASGCLLTTQEAT